ncbi:MAG: ATP-binding cassette domain-containing protein [Candidatus Cloacimonetes bacterium]|nr:ATP-binding cassette domain-containing protein [Candidatus Cloacimonadota bacterium]
MIEIKGISVSFDDKVVLDRVSCRIEKGKISTIIGKSGTGKSVLMKTSIGLLQPSEGDILIDGVSMITATKKEKFLLKKKMAMLFQSSALFDSMTILQNVGFPLWEHTDLPFEVIKDKVVSVLGLVNLSENILDLYPSDLSGGMRKRVALARAIISEPKYMIYDEPTTGLDPLTADEIIKLINALHRDLSMTSIVITHDPECIKMVTQNLIMLEQGNIIYDDVLQNFSACSHQTAKDFARHIF